ncbi:hypothetical protein ACHAXS_008605 [Conticribra weissflogii]
MSSTQDSQDMQSGSEDDRNVNINVKESGEVDPVTLSARFTADIDNTHAYLVRSAERYSQGIENSDEMASVGATRFVKVHKRRNRKSIIEDEEGANFEIDTRERCQSMETSSRKGNSLLHFPSDEVVDTSNFRRDESTTNNKGINLKSSISATSAIAKQDITDSIAQNKIIASSTKETTQEKQNSETVHPQVFPTQDSHSLELRVSEKCDMTKKENQTEESLYTNLRTTLDVTSNCELKNAAEPKGMWSTNSSVKLGVLSDESQTSTNSLDAVISPQEDETNLEECVNFHINPTPLFKYLYFEKWPLAQARMDCHPEDARVWVVRYFKRAENVGSDASRKSKDKAIRWKLLPLHLFIALAGSSDYQPIRVPSIEGKEDVRDELISDENAPPIQLLTSLLSTYPEATTCPDDRGMIPLHSAIRGNSSLIIIEKLLEANPTCIYCKDNKGRDAFAVTRKVFEKRRNRQQGVGPGESIAWDLLYSKVYKLLTDAADCINNASTDLCEKVTHNPNHGKQMRRLQNDILALRRENALLRHRAMNTDQMMREMQERIHLLEQQLSSEIKNYNELFGNEEDINVRRDMLFLSISQESEEDIPTPTEVSGSMARNDDDDDMHESNTNAQEVPDTIEEIAGFATTNEKKHGPSGGGYYTKRLRRYHSLRNSSSTDGDFASPNSTMTTETEATTPPSSPQRSMSSPFPKSTKSTASYHRNDWESRCRALELESFDEDDAKAPAKEGPVTGGPKSVDGDGGRTSSNGVNRDDDDLRKCNDGMASRDLVSSNINFVTESRSPLSNDIFRKRIATSVTNTEGTNSHSDDGINDFTRLNVTHPLDQYQGSKGGGCYEAKQLNHNGEVKTITIARKKFNGIDCESEYCDIEDEASVMEGCETKVDPLLYSIFGSYSMDGGNTMTENLLSADACPADDVFTTAVDFATTDVEKPNSFPASSVHSSIANLDSCSQDQEIRRDNPEQSTFKGEDSTFVDQTDVGLERSSPITPSKNLQISESISQSEGGSFETLANSEVNAAISPVKVDAGDELNAEDLSALVPEKCHASYADAVKSSFASQPCHEKNQPKPSDVSYSGAGTVIVDNHDEKLHHIGTEAGDRLHSVLLHEGCKESHLEGAEEITPKNVAVNEVLPCTDDMVLSAKPTIAKSSDENAVEKEPPTATTELQRCAIASSSNKCDKAIRKIPTVATPTFSSTGGFELDVASEIQRLRERFHLKD